MNDQQTTVTGLEEALKHLDGVQKKAVTEVDLFNHNFKEFVGYHPQAPVNAQDVVSIVGRMMSGKKSDD